MFTIKAKEKIHLIIRKRVKISQKWILHSQAMIIHKGICACYVLPFWYYINIIYILYKFIKQIEETPDMFLYSGSWWLITEDASLRVSNLMHLGNLTLLPDIHIARLKLSGFLWRLQAMILFSQTWQVKSKIPPPPPPIGRLLWKKRALPIIQPV